MWAWSRPVSAFKLLMQFPISPTSSVFVLQLGLMTLLWRRGALGELSVCFIASHWQVGRLQPSPGLLMCIGVLFCWRFMCGRGAVIYGAVTMSRQWDKRGGVRLCVCVSGELDFTCSLSRKLTNLRHIRWVRVTQHTVKRQTASKTCH